MRQLFLIFLICCHLACLDGLGSCKPPKNPDGPPGSSASEAYGEIYKADLTSDFLQLVFLIPTPLVTFDSIGPTLDVTPSLPSGLIIDQAGVYVVSFDASWAAGSDVIVIYQVYVNGVPSPLLVAEFTATGPNIVSSAVLGLLSLNVGDLVQVYFSSNTDDFPVLVRHANLHLLRIHS